MGSEEAAAHHAPKQTTHDYNIKENDTFDLSLELHCGTETTESTELPAMDTEETATRNDKDTERVTRQSYEEVLSLKKIYSKITKRS